jgi:hypothetical protein
MNRPISDDLRAELKKTAGGNQAWRARRCQSTTGHAIRTRPRWTTSGIAAA